MGLLALAIAPGIVICLFIYLKDKYNREPLGLLLVSFILGMLSIIPAIIIQLASGISLETLVNKPMWMVAFFAYVVVGGSEESSKFLVVRLFCYRRKAFDEPFDGLIYSVMVGMGFATLENIGYVMEHGVANGIMRMFLSVPAHATFAVLMGYFVSLAKFNPNRKKRNLLLAIIVPALFHGTFDFFLFLSSTTLHIAGALGSFITAIIISRKIIRKKQVWSQAYVTSVIDTIPADVNK